MARARSSMLRYDAFFSSRSGKKRNPKTVMGNVGDRRL
jgi:hypothetical protein